MGGVRLSPDWLGVSLLENFGCCGFRVWLSSGGGCAWRRVSTWVVVPGGLKALTTRHAGALLWCPRGHVAHGRGWP